MYRQRMAESYKTSAEDANAFTKIGQWPVINDSLGKLSSLYNRTKEYNRLSKFTIGTAEAGVKVAVSWATPVATTVLGKPIHAVNEIACNQLTKLERTYPIVTKPTREVLDETKKLYEPVVSPVVTRFQQIQKYSNDKYEVVRETCVQKINDVKTYSASKSYEGERLVNEKMLQFFNVTEYYVDKYLPPAEGEEKSLLKEEEKNETVKRARVLSTKMKQRLSHYTWQQIKGAKLRSEEVIKKMDKVDLIEYAKQNIDCAQKKVFSAKNRIQDAWTSETVTSEDDAVKRLIVHSKKTCSDVIKTCSYSVTLATESAYEVYARLPQLVQRNWEQTVNLADNVAGFISLNKLTLTSLGGFAVNFTYTGIGLAKDGLLKTKDMILATVGINWEREENKSSPKNGRGVDEPDDDQSVKKAKK